LPWMVGNITCYPTCYPGSPTEIAETSQAIEIAGAARGTRTPDPVITNDVLYQLSYCGEPFGELPSRAHLISGTAPIGKENAGAARHRANRFPRTSG
jgi:hypothetical protein